MVSGPMVSSASCWPRTWTSVSDGAMLARMPLPRFRHRTGTPRVPFDGRRQDLDDHRRALRLDQPDGGIRDADRHDVAQPLALAAHR